ncbi:MAG: hypothetical protein WC941_06855 [Candidatus Bathyarchaeia archaeon]
MTRLDPTPLSYKPRVYDPWLTTENAARTWLYYRELPRVMRFYEEVMAFMFRDPEGYVVEIQQSLPGALSI